MQKFKGISSSAAALLIALTFTVSVPVFAEHGSGSGSENETTNSTATSTTGETEQGTTVSGRQQLADDRQKLQADRQQEQEDRQQLVADHKDANQQHREKVCEAHKQGLTTKFSRIVTNSQRIKTRIDDVLAKTEAYQQSKNVQVSNFDTLVSAAKTAGNNADAAIANLKAVTPSVDCNNTSVATDVANFKVAAAKTRDSLKAYRQSVKAVIQALLQAKTSDSTDGSTSND